MRQNMGQEVPLAEAICIIDCPSYYKISAAYANGPAMRRAPVPAPLAHSNKRTPDTGELAEPPASLDGWYLLE